MADGHLLFESGITGFQDLEDIFFQPCRLCLRTVICQLPSAIRYPRSSLVKEKGSKYAALGITKIFPSIPPRMSLMG
jgi:hypothetical protein